MSDIDFWETRAEKQRAADEHSLAVTLEGLAGVPAVVEGEGRLKASITYDGRQFTVFADTRLYALLELLSEVAAYRSIRRFGR